MQPEFWDVSVPLRDGIPVWPGSVQVSLQRSRDMACGDRVNDSDISVNLHAGTHIDAPLHFLADGASVDLLPLSACIGPATVVARPGSSHVEAEELESLVPSGITRLLLKTDNSGLWSQTHFDPDYVAITPGGASWLVQHGIRLVGIDYLSVERFGGNGDVHRTLLSAGVVVVEGLDLSSVEAGEYWLSCLPARIAGAEAAPVRAVLMRPLPVEAAA